MSIVDIAHLCGLSKSTVSRYLTGGNVSAASAKRIKAAIEETGFELNAAASQLKSSRSGLIGVLIDGIESISIMKTLTGINEQCRKLGYLPFVIFDEPEQLDKIPSIKKLVSHGVDALIFGSAYGNDDNREYLKRCGKPAVVLGQADTDLPYRKVNDFAAGKIMSEHVISTGATTISYLSYSDANPAIGVERRNGFTLTCEQAGLNVNTILVGYPYHDAATFDMGAILQDKPQCIACASDAIALQVVSQLEQMGLHVPGDIKVCGFGNHPASAVPGISLTTIDFDYRALGREVANAAVGLIQNADVHESSSDFDMRLVIRRSTGTI